MKINLFFLGNDQSVEIKITARNSVRFRLFENRKKMVMKSVEEEWKRDKFLESFS